MKSYQGIWMPDREKHLIEWMDVAGEVVDGKGTYQMGKLRLAVAYCRKKRVAIDIGAYCGLWSLQLEKAFKYVHAFEPVQEHRDCFIRNLAMSTRTMLHPVALGDSSGQVTMTQYSPFSTMCASVIEEPGETEMVRLDDFGFLDVDFIKIDCEGYELHVVKGGEQTIRENLPVIIVEQKEGLAQRYGLPEIGAIDYLREIGYSVAEVHSGDYIMLPPSR